MKSDFVGREDVLESIFDWARVDSSRRFLLTGRPGTGKTSIARRLCEVGFPSGQVVYSHFCQSRRDETLNPLRFVEGLSTSLARHDTAFAEALLETSVPTVTITSDVSTGDVATGGSVSGVIVSVHAGQLGARIAFDELVRRPLERADGLSMQLLVVVDAVDEAQGLGGETVLDLLGRVLDPASQLSEGLRFLVTARSDDVRVLDHLGASDFDLGDAESTSHDLDTFVRGEFPAAEDAVVERVVTASDGNFLYARFVVDHLRSGGNLDSDQLPAGLDQVYSEFLRRELAPDRRNHFWTSTARPVLGLIAAGRGDGPTLADIVQALDRDQDEVIDAIDACRPFLAEPNIDGPLRPYHQSFRDFLRNDPTFNLNVDSANDLWARALAQRIVEGDGSREGYVLANVGGHLLEAVRRRNVSPHTRSEFRSLMIALLADLSYLEARTQRWGIDAVLDELRAADEEIDVRPTRDTLDGVAHALRGWDHQADPGLFAHELIDSETVVGEESIGEWARRRLDNVGQPYLCRLWSMVPPSGSRRLQLAGHNDDVVSAAFALDGRVVVSASDDRTLRWWEARSGRPLDVVDGPPGAVPHTVAVVADGLEVVSGWDDGSIVVFEADSCSELRRFATASRTKSLGVSPNGRFAFTAGNTLKIINLVSGEFQQPFGDDYIGLAAMTDRMAAAVIGRRIVIANYDGTERIDLGELPETAISVLWGEAGWLVVGGYGGTITAWATGHGATIGTPLVLQAGELVWDLELTPDERLCAALDDGSVGIWDLPSGARLGRLNGHSFPVRSLSVSPDGGMLVTASEDETLALWDLELIDPPPDQAPRPAIRFVAMSRDGRTMASVDRIDRLVVWQADVGTQIAEADLPRRPVAGDFADDGEFISLLRQGRDTGEVVIERRAIAQPSMPVADSVRLQIGRAGALSREWVGALEILSRQCTLRLVALGSGAEYEFSLPTPTSGSARIALSDVGRAVWRLPSSFARVDPLDNAIEVLSDDRPAMVMAVAISPDGQRSAFGWSDGQIDVWDLDQLRLVRRAQLAGPVNDVGFVSDAVVAVGKEGEICVLVDDAQDLIRRGLVVSPQILATSQGSPTFAVADEWGNMHVLKLLRPVHRRQVQNG